MLTTNEIIDFVKKNTGLDHLAADTDIFSVGVGGDDFHDLIDEFAQTYSVDMTAYLWYFHSDEEGNNIGGLFFPPPYKRVKRIAITPLLLTEFANTGKWDIEYPNHKIPKIRYDTLIGIFIVSIIIGIIITLLIHKK